MTDEREERAARAAAQQAAAEQHHQQALLKSLWEGLGQAVAQTRTANRDAHSHFQLCLQRQV